MEKPNDIARWKHGGVTWTSFVQKIFIALTVNKSKRSYDFGLLVLKLLRKNSEQCNWRTEQFTKLHSIGIGTNGFVANMSATVSRIIKKEEVMNQPLRYGFSRFIDFVALFSSFFSIICLALMFVYQLTALHSSKAFQLTYAILTMLCALSSLLEYHVRTTKYYNWAPIRCIAWGAVSLLLFAELFFVQRFI